MVLLFLGVAKKGDKKSSQPKRVGKLFDANNPGNLEARLLGHSHFDDNKSFSGTDLTSFAGRSGSFILLTKSGEVSFVTKQSLRNDFGLTNKKNVISYLRDIGVPKNTQDTGVYGKSIGNIYDEY